MGRALDGEGRPHGRHGSGRNPVIMMGLPEDPRARVDVGPPFRRLNGGWLALNFVNTAVGWPAVEADAERLAKYADLARWCRLERVVSEGAARILRRSAGAAPERAAAVIARSHGLRASLYGLFGARLRGLEPPSDDLAVLNGELAWLRRSEALVERSGVVTLEWRGWEDELDGLLWPIVRSAIALLMIPQQSVRVGQCAGSGCGWLYVDIGRGRSRRWCDSRDCGNVAKARSYRARHRAE